MELRDRQRRRQTIELAAGLVPVSSWAEPAILGQVSQDACAIELFENPDWRPGTQILRIIVADGVTPTSRTPSFGDLDGAAFAAQQTVDVFKRAKALEACGYEANRMIEAALDDDQRQTLTRRNRPQCAVRAVDVVVAPDGAWTLDLFDGGDCISPLRTADGWLDPIASGGYSPNGLQELAEWRAAHPLASPGEARDKEDEIFARPEDFISTPVGAFADDGNCRFTTMSYEPPATTQVKDLGLLVLSDGMREPSGFDYDQTVALLQEIANGRSDDTGAYLKARDDVTVIAVGAQAPDLAIEN